MNSKAKRRSRSSIHNRALACLYAIGDLVVSLETWRRREQMSMQLAHVDARTLRDAGISEARRFIVINQPFRE
jgi:uncharacterized protein YjiS (DUF1127 family)